MGRAPSAADHLLRLALQPRTGKRRSLGVEVERLEIVICPLTLKLGAQHRKRCNQLSVALKLVVVAFQLFGQ